LPKLVPKKNDSAEPEFMPSLLQMAQSASNQKAENITAYDVRELTLIADAFFMCSAKSEPQIKAIVNRIRRDLKDMGVSPLRVEGETSSGWIVMDYGSIICHIFREKARSFYDLDGLWADAPTFDLDID